MINLTSLTKTTAVALALTAGIASTTVAYAEAAKGEACSVQLEEMAVVDMQITGTTNFGYAFIAEGTVNTNTGEIDLVLFK